ncbi:hypothetical protein NEFER03_1624 [Nematocida sp. LUAm3]|nr:hypothetical protein NEFER03_1624 [Nematocida sp. LUAm3]KAI5176116.1 hypothetical protein NEFER02_1937 [Nematocida sp. LUAm2]KAI5179004.1 hypothetical protein NEFER01_1880 [Nematocida sp. LUAm1]
MEEKEKTHIPIVLTEYSILKEDGSISSIDHDTNTIGFIGANNFRICLNVFGVSQPTAEGIRSIIEHYKKKIIWMNLREEPIIYINGSPYVLRDKTAPFTNIQSFIGISYTRLEEMEKRLKKDIEMIKEKNNGFIEVCVEKHAKKLKKKKIYVQRVETAREVFSSFSAEYIKYYRSPITRNLYNKENFLSHLDGIFKKTRKEYNEIIFGFNCGNGLGRTSYAMAACLIHERIREFLRRKDISHEQLYERKEELDSPGSTDTLLSETEQIKSIEKDLFTAHLTTISSEDPRGERPSEFSRTIRILERIHGKEKIVEWLSTVGNILPALEKALKGEYVAVERLAQAFNGIPAKTIVDHTLYHLPTFSILESLLERIVRAQSVPNAKTSLKKASILMERYVSLVVYGIYTMERIKESFLIWISSTPTLLKYLEDISIDSHSSHIFAPANVLSSSSISLTDTSKWITVIGARTILCVDTLKSNNSYNRSIEKIFITNQPAGEQLLRDIPKRFLWVNLRAEPVVYLGGVPHSERDTHSPHRNIRTIPGITQDLIQNQEMNMCRRIRNEGNKMHGHIILFDTSPENQLRTKTVNTHGKKIVPCDEYMRGILGAPNYLRIPISTKGVLDPVIIDKLLQLFLKEEEHPIILQASSLQGRAKRIRILGISIRYAISYKNNGNLKSTSEEIERPIPIRTIETLIRVVENGPISERIVRLAYIEETEKDLYQEIMQVGELSPEKKHLLLSDYFMMISVISFLLGVYEHNPKLNIPFREWINRRQDIMNLLTELKQENLPKDNKILLIDRPWGNVLTPHTILKNDFFPTLRVTNGKSSVDIKGCSNFREVIFGENRTIGVAQPTSWGVIGLVDHFKNDEYPMHWFCLRQEPIVYLKGMPYVLRTTDQVYENVVTQGITRKWVEKMEERMKNDCIDEHKKTELIVHDEVFSNGIPELLSSSVKDLSDLDIKTPKEVFIHKNMVYYRLPISDEQTPLPEIFDELYQTIISIPTPRRIIFSCQMGRGRTTTGMVISGLIDFAESLLLLSPEKRFDLLKRKREAPIYENNYLIISRLLQVLPLGREGKNIVDYYIDQCNHIQNIYQAIDKQKNSDSYLIRYFYLVCFSSFLIENIGSTITFKEYLEERMEIVAIINEHAHTAYP